MRIPRVVQPFFEKELFGGISQWEGKEGGAVKKAERRRPIDVSRGLSHQFSQQKILMTS
jgi:hypothetical protein